MTAKPRARATPSFGGFRRVVVATDFSLEGDRAVRRAAHLPFAANAAILVVHVVPEKVPLSAATLVTGAGQQELDAARLKLEALLERRGREDVKVRTRITRGAAAAEIGRLARTMGAELIVVGRGGSRLSGTLLGSTAQRVAREARVPVLLVRQLPATPYRRAVVGFDGSADALKAARLARQMASAADAVVFVLHAYEDPRADLAPSLSKAVAKAKWQAFAPVIAEQVRATRKMLALIDPARRWPLLFKAGDPRRRLLETAEKKQADLLVVGTRSRQGLPRLLLGSVAEAVLNQAPCDVLISPRRRLAL